MEIYVERGYSKGDCLQKIVKKHGIYFNILKEKTIPKKLGGLIPEKVEVEYYLSPQRGFGLPGGSPDTSPLPGQPRVRPQEKTGNDSTIDFDEAKKRVLAVAGKNPEQVIKEIQEQDGRETGQQQILEKLSEIQEQIGAKSPAKSDHPNLIRTAQLLKQNDFSDRYITGLLDRARKELPLEILENFNAVQERFLIWIGESIKIHETPEKREGGPGRIVVLIGPTGVGKTTTVAKLAAIYGIVNQSQRPQSVRVYTIDAFRIGGKEQLEKYCEIMEDIPFSYIDNRRELRREIDLYREETDLILIDTIGRSPKDSAKLGEMKELLDVCGSKAEIHLVLSASTKTSDIEHILRQFEPFNYQAVLLTKLDETRHVGNIISALAEREKPISYITDGQDVPKDIKKANVIRFLINLDEFRMEDREKIEKLFPVSVADQL